MNPRIQVPSEAARKLSGNTGGITTRIDCTRPLLVDEREGARLCGISPRKLHQLGKDGAIVRVTIDRRVLYPVEALEAWIALGCPTEPGSAARVMDAVRKGASQ